MNAPVDPMVKVTLPYPKVTGIGEQIRARIPGSIPGGRKHQATFVGDLVSQMGAEDFRLAQQTVTDWARIVREKIEREEIIREFEENNQGRLL